MSSPIHDIAGTIRTRDDDARALEKLVFDKFAEGLPALAAQHPGQDWAGALGLLRDAQAIIAAEGPAGIQSRLKDTSGAPDPKKIAPFNHLNNVLQTVRSYTPVLIARAHETETGAAFESLAEAIREMKKSGYTLKEAAKFFDEIKISKSFTSHPTETLSPQGIRLCLELVAAAEVPHAPGRFDAIGDVIGRMTAETGFGAVKKANILEEIEASDALARAHNEGCNALERFIENTLKQEYGEAPEDFSLDLAPRSWDYDSDGKNNAEGWAMLAKMSGTTLSSVNDTILYLESAQVNDRALGNDPRFTGLLAELSTLSANLVPVHDRARGVTKEIADTADPVQRELAYRARYAEFQDTAARFASVYDFADKKSRGFNFYKSVIDRLDALRTESGTRSENAGLLLDEAFRTLKRNGFALEKGQTRQNDIVHMQIIDNLFRSGSFRARGILERSELLDIDSHGAFSRLDPELQNKIFEKVTQFARQNGNRKDILNDLFEANPLSFDKGGNGYPRQERTLLDRFRLRSLYPLKFDQGIISDCGDMGPTRQMFIADLFGMDKMRHMPLHEDRMTLSRQAELMATFQRFGGKAGVERRRQLTMGDALWDSFLKGRDVHDLSIMRPCSDAERGGGSFTRLEAFASFRSNVETSYNTRTPFELMLGGGMSMGRFGGDVGIARRVIEQELKAVAVRRGAAFSHDDKTERRLMRAALATLYTEQGRARRYYTATAGQVADDFSGKVSEMIYGRLDLEGRVADYTYIQKPGGMSPQMQKLASRLRDRAIEDFMQLRFATDGTGDPKDRMSILTNRIGRMVTCPNIIGYMNNGARPDSKSGSKEMTEVRAIENNERDHISQLHMGGYYSAGGVMKALWHELHDKKSPVQIKDIRDLMNDPEWDYNIFTKNLADAGRADFRPALERAGWANATFDDLVEIGRGVRFIKNRGHDSYRIVHDERVSAEKAYIAKIFYDRLLFIAMTEAALSPGTKGVNLHSSQSDILGAFRPADNGVQVDLGALTKARYPAVVAIIGEHRRNMAAYAVQYMLEDHIAARVAAGDSKDLVVDALGGERFMRQAASSFRAGTVPHWPLWTGAATYGRANIPAPPAGRQTVPRPDAPGVIPQA